MADVKFTDLPVASTPTGAEIICAVQSGDSKQTTINAIPITVLPGTLLPTHGGTGIATITDHGVMLGSGTGAVTPTAVGTNGQIFTGATAADPGWQTASGAATFGTTGVIALAGVTQHRVIVGDASGVLKSLAAATDGQIVVGATGADPTIATMSGDATLAASGALTVGASKITQAKMTGTHTQHALAVYGATDLAALAPSTAGNVATSDGTDWASSAPHVVIPLTQSSFGVSGRGCAPVAGNITRFFVTVITASTGATTAKLQINGVDVTGSSVSIANTDATGATFTGICTAANTIVAGDKLTLVLGADAASVVVATAMTG